MPKYFAHNFEVRLATTEAGLDTAPALSGWESIEYTVSHSLQKVPVGIGSRLQEVYETLLDYSGSISGWYDETPAGGSADILTALGAFQQSAVTPLYIELKNKVTGSKIRLKKCKGDPAQTLDSPDGVSMWSWDFQFEDISKS